ncbi:MAG: hypothetical protein WBA23_25705 [Tunicatimonas sp.]|uniref:hypothetical protein n=1 Tax=Tunicatimonas sp. TaxID=1940096 RepID=UPI003C710F71
MKKKIMWFIALLVLSTPVIFIYLTLANSTDCSQRVIDTYEIHSGIDIPEVDFVSCYYDEGLETRISVYQLNSFVDLNKFELSGTSSVAGLLQGYNLLGESERPDGTDVYVASGETWGTEWTYVADAKSKRLWTELTY